MTGELDPEIERQLEDAGERRSATLRGRELLAHALVGVAFLAAAVPLALGADGQDVDVALLAVLAAGMVLAGRVEFPFGGGYTVPTQLVFVPLLFLVPPGLVPLVVAGTTLLDRVPDFVSGRRHPARAILNLGDSWFAVGPAAVFVAAGIDGVDWSQSWIWVLAFGAQVTTDLAAAVVRERIATGVRPRVQLRLMVQVWAVDAMLSCVGLLAAVAAMQQRFAFLLVLPLLAVLALFARERRDRLDGALELSRTYRGTALLLGDVLGEDDEYTGVHSQGVVALSSDIAAELGLGARERQLVEFGALLHDVGKIAMPKEILHKDGPLDDDEWALMKTHTIAGQRMLDRVGGSLAEVGVVVRASHERWDGAGYPDGLRGDDIPRAARIVACADTYSAMTTDRVYRRARTHDEAIAELRRCAGTQFDPAVVEATVRVLSRAPEPRRSALEQPAVVGFAEAHA